jgi:hypothetical protein
VTPTTLGNVLYANGQNFSATSTSNLFFDSVNTRVGIGCNAPGFLLDVNGASRFNGNVNLTSFTFASSINSTIRAGAASPVQSFIQWGDGSGWQFNFLGNSARTSNVMTLYDNGNIGLGCNTPGYTLDSPGTFNFGNPGPAYIYYHTRPTHVFFGSSRIAGNSNDSTLGVYGNTDYAENRGGSILLGGRNSAFGTNYMQGQARISGVPQEGGGYYGAFTVDIHNGGPFFEKFRIRKDDLVIRSPHNVGTCYMSGPDTGYTFYIINGTNGVYLSNGATSWQAASDIRLKTIVAPISNAVEKLETLTPVYYRFHTDLDMKNRVGLIAQEVNEVYPECISVSGDGMYGLAYDQMVAPLITAVKELSSRLKVVEAKLNV